MKSAFHSDLKATPPLLKNVLYQYMAPNILSGKTHLVKVFKAPGPTNLLENSFTLQESTTMMKTASHPVTMDPGSDLATTFRI
jgi:hypothetical protein